MPYSISIGTVLPKSRTSASWASMRATAELISDGTLCGLPTSSGNSTQCGDISQRILSANSLAVMRSPFDGNVTGIFHIFINFIIVYIDEQIAEVEIFLFSFYIVKDIYIKNHLRLPYGKLSELHDDQFHPKCSILSLDCFYFAF